MGQSQNRAHRTFALHLTNPDSNPASQMVPRAISSKALGLRIKFI